MAGKNQPPEKARVIVYTTRANARKKRKLNEQKREQETRRVNVPRR